MTLYILNYNNYYNRLVKREDSIVDYQPYITYTLQNVNFNPNDHVNAQHVIGTGDYDGTGDYVIAYENNEIVSRWFIIESQRTRAGQWTLTLRRDVVVDYYNLIVDSPMFIEKATLSDDDVGIFNSEGVSVNQIKTNEYTLQDDSKSAWLVGYFNRDLEETTLFVTYSYPTIDFILPEGQTIESYVNSQKAYKLGNRTLSFTYSTVSGGGTNIVYRYHKATLSSSTNRWTIEVTGNGTKKQEPVWGSHAQTNYLSLQTTQLNNANPSTVMTQTSLYINTGTTFNASKYSEVEKLTNDIVQTFDEKVYQLGSSKTTNKHSVNITTNKSTINGTGSIYTYLVQAINPNIGAPTFVFEWEENYIEMTYNQASFETFEFNFPGKNGRVHLNDAPYDMFCIPYKDGGLNIRIVDEVNKYSGEFKSMDSISALTATQSLVEELGKDNIYDLQLLPFCPLQGWSINSDGEFEKVVSRVSEVGGNLGLISTEAIFNATSGFVIFFSTSSQGSIYSERLHLIDTQTNNELPLPLSLENKKIVNECDIWRLCSPNYNGQFQFNAAKMNGITGFNVDYTYLPYSPYIHVNPNFSGLYGKDFDDPRGLICQGDFSISYMSDKWKDYQVQNKNYANIFARGIEYLEDTQKVQRTQQVFNAVTGTIMGGASGAASGALVGGG